MISIVFKKLESHSGEFSESLKRLASQNDQTNITNYSGPESARDARSQGLSHDNLRRIQTPTEADIKYNFEKGSDPSMVTFSPEDQYA